MVVLSYIVLAQSYSKPVDSTEKNLSNIEVFVPENEDFNAAESVNRSFKGMMNNKDILVA
jgi:hypothetical protein